MAEYTYEDIIMDPEDPRLENAIGKECYLSDYPREALKHAINHTIKYRLKSINKEEICPFIDEEDDDNWACIIIKKEEPKPEYIQVFLILLCFFCICLQYKLYRLLYNKS